MIEYNPTVSSSYHILIKPLQFFPFIRHATSPCSLLRIDSKTIRGPRLSVPNLHRPLHSLLLVIQTPSCPDMSFHYHCIMYTPRAKRSTHPANLGLSQQHPEHFHTSTIWAVFLCPQSCAITVPLLPISNALLLAVVDVRAYAQLLQSLQTRPSHHRSLCYRGPQSALRQWNRPIHRTVHRTF